MLLPAALAAVLASAAPASAHATLLTTIPAAGYAGAGPVRQVVLVFDEPVRVAHDGVTVTDTAHRHLPALPARLFADGRQVTVPLAKQLTAGQFLVSWQVTATDGDLVDGTFGFGVDTTAPAAGTGTGTGQLPITTLLRWLQFTALDRSYGSFGGR